MTSTLSRDFGRPVDKRSGFALELFAVEAMRYALALIFLWIGAMKFTDYEASGISPFVQNSPLVGWWHSVLGIKGTSLMLGVYEVTAGILLLLKPVSKRAFTLGAAMATLTFFITLTFLLSTPGVIEPKSDLPILSQTGGFLAKDIVLLGISIFLLGEGLQSVPVGISMQRDGMWSINRFVRLGEMIFAFGLIVLFFLFGLAKFTASEADAIAPLLLNSPLLSWLPGLAGLQTSSYAIGVFEIAAAAFVLAGRWIPRFSVVGAAMMALTMAVTVSLLFTTPGVAAQPAGGFPALSAELGQFLLKDVALLAVTIWLLAKALEQRPFIDQPTGRKV